MNDVREILQNWCNEVKRPAYLHTNRKKKTITICTRHPGSFIGPQGTIINKYRKLIKECGYSKIKFLECEEYFLPGNDWGQICYERAQAFFEAEYS